MSKERFMLAEELQLDTETRDYFDDKFGGLGDKIHTLDTRVARMEERVNNGIVTSEICALREKGVSTRIAKIELSQATMGRRMWAVMIAAIGSLLAAIVAHVTK